MHHELAMQYLAEQRSEQLMAQAERHNGACGPRPVRSFLPETAFQAILPGRGCSSWPAGTSPFRAVGPRTQAVYELGWVMVALADGDFEAAARGLERPLQLLRSAGDTHLLLLPMAQGQAALIRARAGDASALELAAEAVSATRQSPVPQAAVMALARAVEVAVLLGRFDEARPFLLDLLETLRQLGARRWAAEARELAAIVLGDDDPDIAAVALGAARRLRTALNEPPGPAFLLKGALDAATDRVRAALGPARFSAAEREGATLPVDVALARVAAGLRNG